MVYSRAFSLKYKPIYFALHYSTLVREDNSNLGKVWHANLSAIYIWNINASTFYFILLWIKYDNYSSLERKFQVWKKVFQVWKVKSLKKFLTYNYKLTIPILFPPASFTIPLPSHKYAEQGEKDCSTLNVVWMGKVPHSFVCLNTWSLAGGVILEGYGIFSNEALLEESGPLGGP